MIENIPVYYIVIGFVTFILAGQQNCLADSAFIGACWPFFLIIKLIKMAIESFRNK